MARVCVLAKQYSFAELTLPGTLLTSSPSHRPGAMGIRCNQGLEAWFPQQAEIMQLPAGHHTGRLLDNLYLVIVERDTSCFDVPLA